MYREGKIRLLHKLTGMKFLNREYVSVFTRPDWYKVIMFFKISQKSRIDLDQENLCPAFT